MSDVRGSVWADLEIDAIVADYFVMLADEMAGNRVSDRQIGLILLDGLNGRPKCEATAPDTTFGHLNWMEASA